MLHSTLNTLYSKNLHHAYILEGSKEKIIPELFSFLETEHEVSVRGNPDFWHRDFETFGIDDARPLKEMQARKGIDGGKKIFIISFFTITEEAQNTLLKIFEEPTEGTHFFIITPTTARLFPTLLSRVVIVKQTNVSKNTTDTVTKAKQFLTSSPEKRLKIISDLVEEKNKEQATLFLNALEKNIAEHFNAGNATIQTIAQLKKMARARADLMINSPSIKLIFEHLALTL
ncbi:MAG: hypothetical protein HYT93_00555 [Parcubacteria group bacterium]|nr:hypothetical protein [Parcubacteria group bacterium]